MIHTIAPTGHTGSSSQSSASNKFSQQNPESFHSIGMANLTAKFGDLPSIELTTNCTNGKIIGCALERRFLPVSLLCWAVLVVADSRCESIKPLFFGSLARCSQQSCFVSKSTSSSNKLLFSLSSPSSFPTRRFFHYTHPICTDSMHSSLVFH
jgi:hypothetical protein